MNVIIIVHVRKEIVLSKMGKKKAKKYQDIKSKHKDRVEERLEKIKKIQPEPDKELLMDNEYKISRFFRFMKQQNGAKRNNNSKV